MIAPTMRKPLVRRALGEPPPERMPPAMSKARPVAPVPKGSPFAQTPRQRGASRAPKPRTLAKPPNPRKPPVVRDVKGGMLKDMFEIFPDLPRPPRHASRLRGWSRGPLFLRRPFSEEE
jgi:hypothetical protein